MPIFQTTDLIPLLPECIVLLSAIILLLAGAWMGNSAMPVISRSAKIILVASIFIEALMPQTNVPVLSGMFISNNFTAYSKILVLLGAFFSIFLSVGYYKKNKNYMVSEFPVLVLLATAGMLFMISSNNLLALYMGLEMQSLALYILAAIHKNNVKSSEAGLKYFILSAVASGIMLYGISLIYGFSGTIDFSDLAALYGEETIPVGIIVGMVMLVIGLCFKVSAAPFHMWAPDVYEGAPLPVTAFFAAAPKIAAICLFTNVLSYPFADLSGKWQQVVVVISAISMVVGAFGGLRQVNIKRLMAYSSIGHVGYVLVGLSAASFDGIRGVMVYILVYMVMTIGIFACIMMVKQKEEDAEDIYAFSGLAKTRPMLALAVAVILFSMAGIPPFAGFFGKFFVFEAAVKAGLYNLAVLGVLTSVVSAFYYLRIIKIMYFDEPNAKVACDVSCELKFVAFVAAAFNLLLFVAFSQVVDVAARIASTFIK